jgi:hypothetical protein
VLITLLENAGIEQISTARTSATDIDAVIQAFREFLSSFTTAASVAN